MQMKKLVAGVGAAVALSLSGTARADTISFDLDGAGPRAPVQIDTMDWAVGNALAVKGNPVGGLTAGYEFVLLAQAKLGNVSTAGGQQFFVTPGKEFTVIASFPERVISSANGAVSFTLGTSNNDNNFFEVWYGNADANDLAGTGFNNKTAPDGKRVLRGFITGVTEAAFVRTSALGQSSQFDGAGANDYGLEQTINGLGSTSIAVNVTSADADFFPGLTPGQLANLKIKFTTQQALPFITVDPSHLFVDSSAKDDPDHPPVPTVVPNLGPINGVNAGTTALDFQIQADATSQFTSTVIDVPGACRVTYGGNDKNGNVDPIKFGGACSSDKGNKQNCYTFGGQVGAPTADPAQGGPFGEHTHHQVSGAAGDFVFHAGTHSSLKSTRITATKCYDPHACRQAEANAGFKQIDFEGTGSFRELSQQAKDYLKANGGGDILADNASDRIFYFRVDMDDTGEPGNQPAKGKFVAAKAAAFLAADPNLPLGDPAGDPSLESYAACNELADVYQFFICKDENRCEQKDAIYAVRAYLTGGNIQLHKVIK
jgi:hypothetical protein